MVQADIAHATFQPQVKMSDTEVKAKVAVSHVKIV